MHCRLSTMHRLWGPEDLIDMKSSGVDSTSGVDSSVEAKVTAINVRRGEWIRVHDLISTDNPPDFIDVMCEGKVVFTLVVESARMRMVDAGMPDLASEYAWPVPRILIDEKLKPRLVGEKLTEAPWFWRSERTTKELVFELLNREREANTVAVGCYKLPEREW